MNTDFDPVLFGRVLERMDQSDELLEEVLKEMKCMKADIHSLKSHINSVQDRRERTSRWMTTFWSLMAFVLGNAIQWYIFRGPGHS